MIFYPPLVYNTKLVTIMYFYGGGIFLLIVYILLVVHAIKRGQPGWIFFILFFPVVGAAVYFIMNVIPELQGGTALREAGSIISHTIDPSRQIRKLRRELEFSDTITNRQTLAAAYMRRGNYVEAISLYRSCLEGIYEDDPYMLLDLADALFHDKSFKEAKEYLLEIKKRHPNFREKKTDLLLARTYEMLDETDRAIEEYQKLIGVYPGEEVRCRCAVLLKKTGKPEEARKLFAEIIEGAKRSPRYYRKAQKKWIQIARENIGSAT